MENKGFFQIIGHYFENELIINENSMDKLIKYIQGNLKLKKRYLS